MEFSEKIRVLYAISRSMKYQSVTFHGASYDLVEQKCFQKYRRCCFRKVLFVMRQIIRSQRSSTDKTSGPGKLGRRLDGYSAILQ